MRKQETHQILSIQDTNVAQVAIAISLLIITLAIHGDALQMGFGRDDGGGLVTALRLSPADYFLDPPTSAGVSGMSVCINIMLFGLNPYWHHFHLISIVWLTAVATYMLLKLSLSTSWSVLGAILFIAGIPTLYISHEEMSVHYLYGLIFTILSIYLFILSERTNNYKLNCVSAFFYLLSVACKEIYVPLPLILIAYQFTNIKVRLQITLIHWVIFICYAIWRYNAFGGSLIGPKGIGPDLASAVNSFLTLPNLLFGKSIFSSMAAAILTVLGIINIRGRKWMFAISIIVVLLIPLFPVSVNPGFDAPNRLLYLIWWAICVAFSWSGFKAPPKLQKYSLALMAGLCISSISVMSAWRHEIEQSKQRWAEYYSFHLRSEKAKNLYIPNDYEDGYFSISGSISGMIEASIRLGLEREKEVNLITEQRILTMIENSFDDTPENSYILDSSIGRIRQAIDSEEVNRWKYEVHKAANIFISKTIQKYGIQQVGYIDNITISTDQIVISGWGPEGRLGVFVPEHCDNMGYQISDRPDVVAATGRSRWLHSGFRITLRCQNAEQALIVSSNICVVIYSRVFPALVENPFHKECRKISEGGRGVAIFE
jgi:hypothetical protein